MAKSYYAILGVSPDAGREEIKSAYRRLAKKHHPDHAGGDSETFRNIQQAYSVLADDDERRRYEQRRSGPRAGPRVRTRPYSAARAPGAEPLVPDRESLNMERPRRRGPFTRRAPEDDLPDDDLFAWIFRHFF